MEKLLKKAKYLEKIRFVAPVAIVIFFLLVGCAKVYEIDPAIPKPSLLEIEPSCGRTGDTITILGQNFSSITSENELTINKVRAAVFLASDNYLKAIVPAQVGTGPVSVSVKGLSTTGATFEFLPTGFVTQYANDLSIGGLASDSQGNIYFADTQNNRVMKFTPEGSRILLAGDGIAGFIDGAGDHARFNNPIDVAVDSMGNVYVSDSGNDCIRKISPNGDVSLFAGYYPSLNFPQPINGYRDTIRTHAMFNLPRGIAIDKNGNIYVCDEGNLRIRKISPDNGNSPGDVTTLAGNGNMGIQDGTPTTASFSSPTEIAIDKNLDVYVAEWEVSRIRKISNNNVTTIAKADTLYKDCKGKSIQIQNPSGISLDKAGNLYASVYVDESIYKIITISPQNTISILAGGGSNNFQEGIGEDVGIPYAGSITTIGEDLFVAGDYKILKVQLK